MTSERQWIWRTTRRESTRFWAGEIERSYTTVSFLVWICVSVTPVGRVVLTRPTGHVTVHLYVCVCCSALCCSELAGREHALLPGEGVMSGLACSSGVSLAWGHDLGLGTKKGRPRLGSPSLKVHRKRSALTAFPPLSEGPAVNLHPSRPRAATHLGGGRRAGAEVSHLGKAGKAGADVDLGCHRESHRNGWELRKQVSHGLFL